jgi:hypothetical protein
MKNLTNKYFANQNAILPLEVAAKLNYSIEDIAKKLNISISEVLKQCSVIMEDKYSVKNISSFNFKF